MTHIKPVIVIGEADHYKLRRYIHYAAWLLVAASCYFYVSLSLSHDELQRQAVRGDKLAEGFNRCISGKQEVGVQVGRDYFIISCDAWALEAPIKGSR